jgi:hypothetical protein
MIITQSPTIRTRPIPRAWVPTETPALSPTENYDDAVLLELLSRLCAKSYTQTAKTFVTDTELNFASHRRAFGRGKGRFLWRPIAFLFMPINFVLNLFSFVALVIPLIGLGALLLTLWENHGGGPFQFWVQVLMTSLYGLLYLFVAATALGLVVGTVIAFAPSLASARAFGLVQPEHKRAIVVFCGSKRYENLTINALVWFAPLFHMGFFRAWDHIRPDVRQWLKDLVKDGQVTEVVFTGHSLGGALAQIAAFDLCMELPVGHVISLGSACIGTKKTRERFKTREVLGGGLLHDRTRHFTYLGDVMPRIPPSSIFAQVGRQFRLPKHGGPQEGVEDTILKSFIAFFENKMVAFASFFLDVATAIRHKLNPARKSGFQQAWTPQMSGSQYDFTMSPGEQRVTAKQLIDYGSIVLKFVQIPKHYAISLGIAVAVALPIIVLATMYSYYFAVIGSGLLIKHALHNYRTAFKNYLASFEQSEGGTAAPSAVTLRSG